MKFLMFFVYILQSQKDLSFYIGQTNNLEKRLSLHNAEESRYTSKKVPWKIVYSEQFQSRKEAIEREKFLKKQRNRTFYKSLIENFSGK